MSSLIGSSPRFANQADRRLARKSMLEDLRGVMPQDRAAPSSPTQEFTSSSRPGLSNIISGSMPFRTGDVSNKNQTGSSEVSPKYIDFNFVNPGYKNLRDQAIEKLSSPEAVNTAKESVKSTLNLAGLSGVSDLLGSSENQASAGQTDAMGNIIPSGYSQGRLQNATPEQMELLKYLQGLIGPESDIGKRLSGNEEYLKTLEKPAWRNFQEVQSAFGNKFSSLGLGNSGAAQAMKSRTGREFSENLAAQRQTLQRQAVQDLMGISNQLLGYSPYENFLVENPKGARSGFENLIGTIMPILATIFGKKLGIPGGAKLGANIGSVASQAFLGD